MRKAIRLPLVVVVFPCLPAWGGPAVSNPEVVERIRAHAIAQLGHPQAEAVPAPASSCLPQLLLCGQAEQASLAATPCTTTSDGTILDVWAFPAYSAQPIGIAVGSSAFPPAFILIDSSGNLIATGQAPLGGIASAGAFLLGSGTYGIGVFAPTGSSSTTGDYTLAIACDEFPCKPDVATMCLDKGRFRLQAAWTNQFNNQLGFSRAFPRTDQAGFFSFGDPSNIELITKVLDFGTAIKVFYGELTNLQFSLAVTDMLETATPAKTYKNTRGDCGGIDQNAFPGGGKLLAGAAARGSGGCRTDKNTLCLLGRRFAVTVTWMNQYNGTSGSGSAISLSDLTGAFYFTDRSNLELLFKMLDFGDRVAVFYGTLSDLAYTATVVDTLSGQAKTYMNAPGNFCGGLENAAFPP
jgi:hypothetical protein